MRTAEVLKCCAIVCVPMWVFALSCTHEKVETPGDARSNTQEHVVPSEQDLIDEDNVMRIEYPDELFKGWVDAAWKELLPAMPQHFRDRWGSRPRIVMISNSNPYGATARFDDSGEPAIIVSKGMIIGLLTLCEAIELDRSIFPNTQFEDEYLTYHRKLWPKGILLQPRGVSMANFWFQGELEKQESNLVINRTQLCLKFVLAHEVGHLVNGDRPLPNGLDEETRRQVLLSRELNADAHAARFMVASGDILRMQAVIDLLEAWASMEIEGPSPTHRASMERARLVGRYVSSESLLRFQRFVGATDDQRKLLLDQEYQRIDRRRMPGVNRPVRLIDLVRGVSTTRSLLTQPPVPEVTIPQKPFTDTTAKWLREIIADATNDFSNVRKPVANSDATTTSEPPTSYELGSPFPGGDRASSIQVDSDSSTVNVTVARSKALLELQPEFDRLVRAIKSSVPEDWIRSEPVQALGTKSGTFIVGDQNDLTSIRLRLSFGKQTQRFSLSLSIEHVRNAAANPVQPPN